MGYTRVRGHGRGVGVLLVALSTGGCAAFGGKDRVAEEPVPSATAERVVALDFVAALGQLEGYGPFETVVRLDRDAGGDTFLSAMRGVLLERGYGVQLAGAGATDVLRYRRIDGAADTDGTARRETYEIALNAVEMRRDYAFSAEGGVAPSSPLYVRGVDASNLATDDSIFEATVVEDATVAEETPPSDTADPVDAGPAVGELLADGDGVRIKAAPSVPLAAAEPFVTSTIVPSTADIAGEPPASATSATRAVRARFEDGDGNRPSLPGELLGDRRAAAGNERSSIAALTDRDVNMFDLGTSNFDELFDGYVNVDETILVFADESLVLGQRNKRRVQAMADAHDPERDVFSVIGCSLGPTGVAGGNAALALGRAGRVREALLFAGVDQERILDEGCWAGEQRSMKLPTRGVVLTLKRRRG